MKFLILLVGVTLSGLTSASPSFKWLDDQTSPDGVPLLSINFGDGGEDDVAILSQFNPIPKGASESEDDIDKCIFHGFLRDEEKVYVTLTGGCPFEDSFELQFRSSRIADYMFKVVNGHVNILTPRFPGKENYFKDVALKAPGAEHSKTNINQPPANGYFLKIKMFYDQTFKSVFSGDSVNAMRRVVAQAQNTYYFPTLPTVVTLGVVAEEEIPYSINADQPSMDFVGGTYPNDGNINSFYFLSNQNDASPAAGLGYVNVVCLGDLRYRIAISEYYYNDIESGQIMAHELGHNLGMNHDFLSSPSDPRYDNQGQICTGINGVMDYSSRNKWTTCSFQDFQASDHSCVQQN